MPTIGIAVPCYKGHFHYVNDLLANLARSSIPPAKIVIACSGWDKTGTLRFDYAGIPVDILFSTQRMDTAANRNRAARALTTDFIAFLDVDDFQHPKRLEYLLEAFATTSCDAVYHGFRRMHRHARTDDGPDPGPLTFTPGCAIHAGHVAVRTSLIRRIQFDERLSAWRQEDSLYKRTLETAGVRIAHVENALTDYLYLGDS